MLALLLKKNTKMMKTKIEKEEKEEGRESGRKRKIGQGPVTPVYI